MKRLSVEQAIIDLQAQGVPGTAEILEWLKHHKGIAKKADECFQAHRYPDERLTYHRTNHDIVLNRMTPAARQVLDIMTSASMESNLVQVSSREMAAILNLQHSTAAAAIQELLDMGCIAVKEKGAGRRAPVYMIHPNIMAIGKSKPYNGIEAYSSICKTALQCKKIKNLITCEVIYNKELEITYSAIKKADAGTSAHKIEKLKKHSSKPKDNTEPLDEQYSFDNISMEVHQ